ncbi:MAG: hypothetical protein IJ598_05855 [Ruminococcus sp.]|nr:hypothetical protein [Ruminococcus sp.]
MKIKTQQKPVDISALSHTVLDAELAKGIQSLKDGKAYTEEKYNAETEQAIFEAHNGINLSEPYNSVAELREALHAED